jgi:hypothetical protein
MTRHIILYQPHGQCMAFLETHCNLTRNVRYVIFYV